MTTSEKIDQIATNITEIKVNYATSSVKIEQLQTAIKETHDEVGHLREDLANMSKELENIKNRYQVVSASISVFIVFASSIVSGLWNKLFR